MLLIEERHTKVIPRLLPTRLMAEARLDTSIVFLGVKS